MKYLVLILSFFFQISLHAGIETRVAYISGQEILSHQINPGAAVNYQATLFPNDFFPQGNPDWQNGYAIKSIKSWVELYIDPSVIPNNLKYSLNVPVKISYYNSSHVFTEVNHTLIVDHDPSEGSHHRQLDMWLMESAYSIKVEIISDDAGIAFSQDTFSVAEKEVISNSLKLKVVQEYDKIVNFDHLTPLEWNQIYFDFNATENIMEICWKVIEGAEQYDLEWGFIERYDNGLAFTNLPLTTSNHDFNQNSTRVTITQNCYKMPIVYEQGALVFRVRGRGKVLPDLEHTVLGVWSCGKWANNCNNDYSAVSPNFNNWHHKKWFLDGHEKDNKNWQIVTSFAEEGKRKDVVNYMDGTMRTRQTVTLNNSDNNVLVAETLYDHQGRAAVQILPVPMLHDPALKFREKFNRNMANQAYSKSDFDLDGVPCGGAISPLNSATGAAYYYSTQFYTSLTPQEKESHLAYIPESFGYPMIQTEYTPDNTGRIQRQGGVGSTFQLESGHETKYYYGTPAQEHLDYLFGSNVGVASHYKKNMVMDPNGQISVSYLDAKGNTIATALAGQAPDNLEQLSSYQPFPMTIDLLAYNRIDSMNYSLDATYTHIVTAMGDQNFYYGVTAEQFTVPGCTPSNVCYDCIYDLELLVVSNECPDTFYHFTKTIGQFFTSPPGPGTSTGGSGNARLNPLVNGLQIDMYGLDTDCASTVQFNTNMLPQNNSFMVPNMPVGSYSVIKKLKVNQDAAQAYLEHYINDPNNVCTDILEDLIQDELDLIDEGDCNIECEDVEGSADPDDIEMANEVCDTLLSNPCDIAFETMKAHMAPGGQYAEYDPITYFAGNKPLSIFNTSSYQQLPQLKYTMMDFGGITTINDAGATVSPNQLSVPEFVQNFELEWLDKMVPYHPEYCMYERCRDKLYDANTYLNLVLQTETFAEAVANNMISDPLLPFAILTNDVYFQVGQEGYDKLVEMQGMMQAYPNGLSGQPSIWNLAAAAVFCGGGVSDVACLGLIDLSYVQGATPEAANLFWAFYKSFYITLREKIEYQKRVAYAMDPGNCYNECIGQINFSPFRNEFVKFNPTPPPIGFIGEYYNDEGGVDGMEPCNSDIFFYFHDKKKAFPSPYDMLPNMDLDFWETPTWQLAQAVMPSIPENPCDTCSCPLEFSRMLNMLLLDLFADQYANGTAINMITMPMAQLKVMFPKLNVGGSNGNVTFAVINNQIVINFGEGHTSYHNCKINTGLTLAEVLAVDSISVRACPTITNTNFYYTTYDWMGNPSPKEINGTVENCTFSCKEIIPEKKCEAYSIAQDVFNFIQTLQNTTPITTLQATKTYDVDLNAMSASLRDSLFAHGWTAQDTLVKVITSASGITINLIRNECDIHLNMGTANALFGTPAISHFSNFKPDYNAVNGDGNTYAFIVTVHLMNGTTVLATGDTKGCIPLGRCCKDDTAQRSKPSTKAKNTTKTINKTRDKNLASKTKPAPKKGKGQQIPPGVPYDPRPTIPHDPLCDGCQTIDIDGGLLDDVVFPPCDQILCDTSYFTAIYLDSMPDPCIEHLYDVAEANAYLLYEEIIDSISMAFLHAYNMKCLQAAEVLNNTSTFTEHHFTLYYYDQSNNLVQTVPPNGVEGLDASELFSMKTYRSNQSTGISPNPIPTVNSIKKSWSSEYKFNSLNQIREQKIPDQGYYDAANSSFIKEATLFWYDYLGRIVASQSPEQRTKKEYSYTIYDGLGRITEVGAINSNNPPPNSPINTKYNNNLWQIFINNTKSQITTTTYDHDYYNGSFPSGFPVTSVDHLRGRVGAAAVYDTEAKKTLGQAAYVTHYSYDIHGNVKALVQDGENTPAKLIEYDYDLISGKVNEVHYQRGQRDQFIHRYRYDADNRLISASTSQNAIHWAEDARYIYYPHGPLARTEIGEYEVQGLDYAYTLQGWIKGMNSGSLTFNHDMGKDGKIGQLHEPFARDEVGYILHYHQNDYRAVSNPSASNKFDTDMTGTYLNHSKQLYNGNIRAMITAIDRFIPTTGVAGYSYQYDQLHRINGVDYFKGLTNNSWQNAVALPDYQTRYGYDANGNILSLNRNGTTTNAQALDMDKLSYTYDQGNNRLTHVDDVISTSNYTTDIDDQKPNNYEYDRNGNLVRDHAEGLTIFWNLSGKVRKIAKDNGTTITFRYDALGNRISKQVDNNTTWYVRDANGNAMANYNKTGTTGPVATGLWTWTSVTMYGSSRLGEINPILVDPLLQDTEIPDPDDDSGTSARQAKSIKPLEWQGYLGRKQYELTNHLGNVLATISDRRRLSKTYVGGTGIQAHLITAQDYYPEGMIMPSRSYSTEKYDQKHQGQLSDPEVYGEGNSYFYKYRMSDPRLCRFWSADPLHQKYPHYSNYQFSGNKLISHVEIEGLEEEGIIYQNPSDKIATDEKGNIELDKSGNPIYQSIEPAEVFANNLDNMTQSISQLSNLEGVISTFNTTFNIAAQEEMKVIYKYGTKIQSATNLTYLNKESWNYLSKQVGIVGKEVGKLGYPLILADVAYNSNIKHSHVINATMIAISTTGVGAIVAGSWFILDTGVKIISDKSISERIDEDLFRTPLIDW